MVSRCPGRACRSCEARDETAPKEGSGWSNQDELAYVLEELESFFFLVPWVVVWSLVGVVIFGVLGLIFPGSRR